ncbi:Hsp70 family protein [candidate division WWE3 bacterium]|uniref:Hsp70 family protein n=1 Tax=candidate division WWE3 bacterium TaxID=2053526 RepID=A0A955LGS8_UNCKA|nr:Hsp70 family protein [candidate division WWE3 bacterium]
MNNLYYGLDFGTSNSVISIVKNGNPELIVVDPTAENSEVLQSLLYFRKDGSCQLGEAATAAYLTDNAARKPVQWKEIDTGEERKVEIVGDNGIVYYTTTIKIKVDINKPGQFVQALKTTLREGSLSTAYIFDKKYSLESLIAKLLRQMKDAADKQVGHSVTRVVLGRPVHYLSEGQDDRHVEDRMQIAAKEAGFTEVSFLAEPIAAALSYLIHDQEDKTILVFDFGGGTLDYSIVNRPQGGRPSVIGTGGLSIGGNTFNEEIMVRLLSEHFGVNERWGPKRLPMPAFLKESLRRWYELDHLQTTEIRDFLKEAEKTVDNSQSIVNLQDLINFDLGHHLFRVIENAKRTLSDQTEAEIHFERERLKLHTQITREEFERILDPFEVEIDRSLDALMDETHLSSDDIDHVVATGGSTLIPKFQNLLFDKFGQEKVEFHDIFTGVGAGLALADQLEI